MFEQHEELAKHNIIVTVEADTLYDPEKHDEPFVTYTAYVSNEFQQVIGVACTCDTFREALEKGIEKGKAHLEELKGKGWVHIDR